MPAGIDWKAEDEKEWGDFEPDGGHSPGGWRGPGRRLKLAFLVFSVVVAVAAVIIWQIDGFLDSSTQETEQALLDGHGLVMDAAARKDGDLARSLIYDRLHEWTDAQVQLVQQGLLLDRWPLGLNLAGATPSSIEVELDPALREATVKVVMLYRLGEGSTTDWIRLQQMFAYRFEDDRWLLNPPTGAFWGRRLTAGGRYLTLSYPELDAEISEKLAADLEVILGQACHAVEMMNCRDGMQLAVDLTVDPEELVALADPAWQLEDEAGLRLPTPSLVGLPDNEVAYRALYRAYAQRVVARQIAVYTHPAESNQPLLSMALSELILHQLGLNSFSEGPAKPPLEGQKLIEYLEEFWNSAGPLEEQLTNEEVETARAVVNFLATSWSEEPETEMLRLLAQSGSAREWLRKMNPSGLEADLVTEWERHVATSYEQVEPQEWPDEVVLLMCDQGVIGSKNVYQYDPVEEILSKVLSGREFIRMESLPDGEGVLLTEQAVRQDEQRTYLWRNGRLKAYETDVGQPGLGKILGDRWVVQASVARQNETAAFSNDGRWLAELSDGILILSAPGEGLRRVVAHEGRECRGVAWVQVAADESGD